MTALPPPTSAHRDLASETSDSLGRMLITWQARLTSRQRQILATAQSLAELLAAGPDPADRCRCSEIPHPHYNGDHA